MHLEGKGRNEIAESFKHQVSSGKISNVLKHYREQPESLNESNARVTTFPEEGLSETEFKNNKDISIENHAIVNTQDFEENGYPLGQKGGPLSWFTNGIAETEIRSQAAKTQSKTPTILTDYYTPTVNSVLGHQAIGMPSMKSIINTKNRIQSDPVITSNSHRLQRWKNVSSDSQDVLEETVKGFLSAQEIESSKPKVQDTSESIEEVEAEPLFTKTNKLAKGPSTPVEERLEQEKVAWDYYGPAWMRILKQTRKEKDERRHELLMIDRRKQKLSEWKKRLEQMQYDLTVRESRIIESEPFLPLARQLQEMKLALQDALPWIETIREKAEAENVDTRTTAINVAQELRLYRQSGGIQKQIERANQELALINMETIQKQQALTVLIDLLNRGVTESQIVQLINFAGEWNKYWQSSTTNGNLQQSVNGSNNPGSSGGNGGNFSIND